jgi:purine-nucleoside phosphorylase
VLGISLISNLAAGISKVPLTHQEVMETGERVAADFVKLIRAVVPKIARSVAPNAT